MSTGEAPLLGADIKRFGKYEILAEISRGGMGVVYKARQQGLDRIVALKVLLKEAMQEPELVGRFLREAKAVARLSHPNIVQIFEIDHFADQHYFTMEFVNGRTLADIIKEGQLGLTTSLVITRDIAKALDYAHQRGIIHRDLKPANIMIAAAGGRPLLMDFGLAKDNQAKGEVDLTQPGMILGTPSFMAPEQIESDAPPTPSMDIYGLGAVLYRLITGQNCYGKGSVTQIIARKMNSDPQPPRELNPELPEVIAALCMKCLARRPEDRYVSGTELARAIETFLREPGATPTAATAAAHAPFPGDMPRDPLPVCAQRDPAALADLPDIVVPPPAPAPAAPAGPDHFPLRAQRDPSPPRRASGIQQRPSGVHQPRRPSGVAEVPRAAKARRSGVGLLVFALLLVGGAAAGVVALGGPGPAWAWARARLGDAGSGAAVSLDQDAAQTAAAVRASCGAGDFRAAVQLFDSFAARHAGEAATARHREALRQEIRESARGRYRQHEESLQRLIGSAQPRSYVQAIELHQTFLTRWGDLTAIDEDLQSSVQACPDAVVEAACRQARDQGASAAARDLLGELDEAVRAAHLDGRLSDRIAETLAKLEGR